MIDYDTDEDVKIGEPVRIKLLELYGYITAILLRGTGKQYEISFFSNSEYKTIWVERFQFDRTQTKISEEIIK